MAAVPGFTVAAGEGMAVSDNVAVFEEVDGGVVEQLLDGIGVKVAIVALQIGHTEDAEAACIHDAVAGVVADSVVADVDEAVVRLFIACVQPALRVVVTVSG